MLAADEGEHELEGDDEQDRGRRLPPRLDLLFAQGIPSHDPDSDAKMAATDIE